MRRLCPGRPKATCYNDPALSLPSPAGRRLTLDRGHSPVDPVMR
jgi:hypothetical protein